MPERKAIRKELLERRERHQRRPLVVRAAVAAGGALILLGALPVIVILPEAGVPMLIAGLGLLALESDIAATAFTWVVWRWRQFKRWFAARPWPVKVALIVALLGVLVLLVFLALS